jgi:transposase-like protein
VRIRYIGLGLALVVVLWWLTAVAIAAARGRKIPKCPHCHSTRVRRSWPRLADYILFPASIRPYRCEPCQKRFYGIRRKRANEPTQKSMKAAGGS